MTAAAAPVVDEFFKVEKRARLANRAAAVMYGRFANEIPSLRHRVNHTWPRLASHSKVAVVKAAR